MNPPEPKNEEEKEFARAWYLAGIEDGLKALNNVFKNAPYKQYVPQPQH